LATRSPPKDASACRGSPERPPSKTGSSRSPTRGAVSTYAAERAAILAGATAGTVQARGVGLALLAAEFARKIAAARRHYSADELAAALAALHSEQRAAETALLAKLAMEGRERRRAPTAYGPTCSYACWPITSNGTCAKSSNRFCSTITTRPRPTAAQRKARNRCTDDGLPVHSFRSLLADLATVTRNVMAMDGAPEASFVLYPQLTPVQDRAFQLLDLGVKV
jgi:hypothetical protein